MATGGYLHDPRRSLANLVVRGFFTVVVNRNRDFAGSGLKLSQGRLVEHDLGVVARIGSARHELGDLHEIVLAAGGVELSVAVELLFQRHEIDRMAEFHEIPNSPENLLV